MRILPLFVVSFACTIYAAGYDDVTLERFPDADAVTVDESERVKYAPDGTSESVNETVTKILTEKGRRSESVFSLTYSRRYGDAVIERVSVTGADGVEREIDIAATTKESTDNSSMSANIYDPLDRKITCSIPGLKIGDVLRVRTRRRTLKPRCAGKWADIAVMEWSHPILKSVYEVTAPAELPLRRKAVRNPLGNVTGSVRRTADGSVVHTYVCTNSPQAFPDPDMPPLYTQVQNVRLSTAEDWPEISRWYWDLCRPHLEKTNAAISNKVAEIGKDVRALFKFVSQEIRYMGLTMEDTSPGYAPHDVSITFDNRYGVCRDKAALLAAMLRIAGHNAFPVLIHAGAKLDPEVPQPFFNHAVVAVELSHLSSPKYLLMDPTDENAKDIFPSYLGNCSYLVCRPEGENLMVSPVQSPEKNSIEAHSKGRLCEDGSMVFESEISFNGINDTAYRHAFVRRRSDDRIKLFDRFMKAMSPGAELIKCVIAPEDMRDTEKPVKVSLLAKLPESVIKGKTRDELIVPCVTKVLGVVNFLLAGNTSLEKRRFPLVVDSTAAVNETVEIELGDALGEIAHLPGKESIEGVYSYQREFSVTGTTLRVRRARAVSAVEFSPSEYLALRENIKRVETAERKRPQFAAGGVKGADVHYRTVVSESDVVSDTRWTTTNTVEKKILTYDGKKSSAELKFSYHPSWKKVEIVSAAVIGPNGVTNHLGAKEMNVMDSSWAAAAPRYPAGKTLVANLPAVEIGSVISYKVATSVFNAPAPFRAECYFDSREPVDRKVFRVNGWCRRERNLARIPNESSQGDGELWRDVEIVSSNDWKKAAANLVRACDVRPVKKAPCPRDLRSIRDWMALNVRVCGPSLYELPLSLQLTDPAAVVEERYATRLDYVRTMCALLKGAGYDADIVFASANQFDDPRQKRLVKLQRPDVREFASALCRVRGVEVDGRGASEIFLGTENEYTPIGATAFAGGEYFDPVAVRFGTIAAVKGDYISKVSERTEIEVRENGAVDMTVTTETYGPGVGAFRKRFAEILPEELSRLHQRVVGAVAQAATATGELECDIKSYPAVRKFSCYVPDYTVQSGDTLSLTLPPCECPLPAYTGSARRTPFGIAGGGDASEETVVRFPEGYRRIEHLPEPLTVCDPLNPALKWFERKVSSAFEDGRLTVRITCETFRRFGYTYTPDRFEQFKEWRRIITSRGNREIVVRR